MASDSPDTICQRPQPAAGWGLLIVLGLVMLPMLYVLSVGPASWLALNDWLSYEVYDVVYEPLDWLAEHSTPCAELLDIYIEWWEAGSNEFP